MTSLMTNTMRQRTIGLLITLVFSINSSAAFNCSQSYSSAQNANNSRLNSNPSLHSLAEKIATQAALSKMGRERLDNAIQEALDGKTSQTRKQLVQQLVENERAFDTLEKVLKQIRSSSDKNILDVGLSKEQINLTLAQTKDIYILVAPFLQMVLPFVGGMAPSVALSAVHTQIPGTIEHMQMKVAKPMIKVGLAQAKAKLGSQFAEKKKSLLAKIGAKNPDGSFSENIREALTQTVGEENLKRGECALTSCLNFAKNATAFAQEKMLDLAGQGYDLIKTVGELEVAYALAKEVRSWKANGSPITSIEFVPSESPALFIENASNLSVKNALPFSLSLEAGKALLVVGESGVGKSTLIDSIDQFQMLDQLIGYIPAKSFKTSGHRVLRLQQQSSSGSDAQAQRVNELTNMYNEAKKEKLFILLDLPVSSLEQGRVVLRFMDALNRVGSSSLILSNNIDLGVEAKKSNLNVVQMLRGQDGLRFSEEIQPQSSPLSSGEDLFK